MAQLIRALRLVIGLAFVIPLVGCYATLGSGSAVLNFDGGTSGGQTP